MSGATGDVLKRSHASLGVLIDRAVNEVRDGTQSERQIFSITSFIEDAVNAARLESEAAGCGLLVPLVPPGMFVLGNRTMLLAALGNLLQNAFKFTHANTDITLRASASEGKALIEVHDHCGGLPHGATETMFTPFTQRSVDRTGLGLGLAIARHSVEADFGTLSVRDVPGTGCVFAIALPLHLSASPPSTSLESI